MRYALGTIIGTALLGLAKSKSGGRNVYRPRKIEDIYNISPQKKALITGINLSGKYLAQTPDDIFDGFTKLKWLWLEDNQLTELPNSIGNLTNLEKLWLVNNQLTELPQSIGNLTNLKKLNLRGNRLTELPQSIGNFTNLESIWLDSNPWEKPVPKKIIFKMISNRVHKNVIETIIRLNNSIANKSNLRIR